MRGSVYDPTYLQHLARRGPVAGGRRRARVVAVVRRHRRRVRGILREHELTACAPVESRSVRRRARAIARRYSPSRARRPTAAASAAVSPGATSSPPTPSSTTSTMPDEAVATTGRPDACARGGCRPTLRWSTGRGRRRRSRTCGERLARQRPRERRVGQRGVQPAPRGAAADHDGGVRHAGGIEPAEGVGERGESLLPAQPRDEEDDDVVGARRADERATRPTARPAGRGRDRRRAAKRAREARRGRRARLRRSATAAASPRNSSGSGGGPTRASSSPAPSRAPTSCRTAGTRSSACGTSRRPARAAAPPTAAPRGPSRPAPPRAPPSARTRRARVAAPPRPHVSRYSHHTGKGTDGTLHRRAGVAHERRPRRRRRRAQHEHLVAALHQVAHQPVERERHAVDRAVVEPVTRATRCWSGCWV